MSFVVVEGSHEDSSVVAARLRAAVTDLVVMAEGPVPPNAVPDLLTSARALIEGRLGVALIAGNLLDPSDGRPWTRPGGLAFTGHPLPLCPPPDERTRTLLPGSLWVARVADLDEIGGLDPTLPTPFAGIDLAWKLWAAGHDVVFDPALSAPATESSPVHRTGSTAAIRAEAAALTLLNRHLDDTSLALAMPAARSLSPHRLSSCVEGIDSTAGLRMFDAASGHEAHTRYLQQKRRRRPDGELLGLFGDALSPDTTDPAFIRQHAALVADPAMRRFAGRRRVVVATADALSPRMAGPAIRATRIARALATAHEVRLVSITQADLQLDDVTVLQVDPDPDIEHDGIDELVEWCDVFVFQGWVLSGRESVARSDRIFVADIYDPLHLEQLEQSKDEGERQRRGAVRHATAVLNDQLLRGDYLLCASEKQRDLWLGQLAALGRVNPATYDADPELRRLLDIVPFGIEDQPPIRTGAGFRDVLPEIGPDDPVILWGGGIYNWFDPLTLLRAVDRLRADHPTIRLVFMGMRHPNPGVPEMRMAVATRDLSDALGLTGTHVFFNEGWVPYDERQNHLLDADIAVSTHFLHVETAFSFRTRILDYFWASLPTVCTAGDSLAALVEQRGLGRTVPPEDVDALTDALAALLDDPALVARCRADIEATVPHLHWNEVLRPLVAFCADPRRAPDHMQRLVDPTHPNIPLLVRGRGADSTSVVIRDLELLRRHLRDGGPILVLRQLARRARRLMAR